MEPYSIVCFRQSKILWKTKPFTTQTLEFGLWTVTRESHLLSISFVRLTQTVHISQWQQSPKGDVSVDEGSFWCYEHDIPYWSKGLRYYQLKTSTKQSLDLNPLCYSCHFLFQTFKVPASTPVGPESWLGEDDVTTFTGISYLGSLKMKKSYLLINESITSLLEKAHPKEFKSIYLEVHPEQIRLIDARDNKILHQHAIPWILKLGVYEEDPRLFGYIVSEARQGEKTRMICHVFRCSRITSSVAATEAIRLGCQATYSDRRDSVRSRKVSFVSSGSNASHESSSPPPSPVDTSDALVGI